MNWLELVNEALPPPRGDEPGNLRRDIADELADHFDCALRVELLRTPDEEAALRRVRERFGDPGRVARQLWLDAMKEQIMKDRVMMIGVAVMCLVSVVIAGMMWSVIQGQQAVNQQLLAKLASLAEEKSDVPLPFDWGRLSVIVTREGGESAANVMVLLSGALYNQEKIVIEHPTDETGKVDFGSIRAGQHHVIIRDETTNRVHERAMVVGVGGQAQELRITIPKAADPGDVSFEFDWPESWRKAGIVVGVLCGTLEPDRSSVILNGSLWRPRSSLNFERVLSADGGIYRAVGHENQEMALFHAKTGERSRELFHMEPLDKATVEPGRYVVEALQFFVRSGTQVEGKPAYIRALSERPRPRFFGAQPIDVLPGQTARCVLRLTDEFVAEIDKYVAEFRVALPPSAQPAGQRPSGQ